MSDNIYYVNLIYGTYGDFWLTPSVSVISRSANHSYLHLTSRPNKPSFRLASRLDPLFISQINPVIFSRFSVVLIVHQKMAAKAILKKGIPCPSQSTIPISILGILKPKPDSLRRAPTPPQRTAPSQERILSWFSGSSPHLNRTPQFSRVQILHSQIPTRILPRIP